MMTADKQNPAAAKIAALADLVKETEKAQAKAAAAVADCAASFAKQAQTERQISSVPPRKVN